MSTPSINDNDLSSINIDKRNSLKDRLPIFDKIINNFDIIDVDNNIPSFIELENFNDIDRQYHKNIYAFIYCILYNSLIILPFTAQLREIIMNKLLSICDQVDLSNCIDFIKKNFYEDSNKKTLILNQIPSYYEVLRFLKSKYNNLELAYKMYFASLNWRIDNLIDNILLFRPFKLEQFYCAIPHSII